MHHFPPAAMRRRCGRALIVRKLGLAARTASAAFFSTGGSIDFGIVSGVAITFTDISEREQIAAAKESERAGAVRSRLVGQRGRHRLGDRSPHSHLIHAVAAAEQTCAEAPIGKAFWRGDRELTFADAAAGADVRRRYRGDCRGGTPVQGLKRP